MASLVVMKFPTADGAEKAVATLIELAQRHLIEIQDAAVVTWPEGKKKPQTKQAVNLTAAGALSGGFWGMLFGLIFFVPLLGAAVGAAMGRVGCGLSRVGRGLCLAGATSFLFVVSQYYDRAQLYIQPLSEPDLPS